MDPILEMFLIFAGAKAAGELSVRLRQPAIVGELVVGIALGPHLLGWIHVGPANRALADLGIVVLLFTVGLETRLPDLLSTGRSSLLSSLAGLTLTAGAAFAVIRGFGYSARGAALGAIALAASSVGVAARAFADIRSLDTPAARVVLGAAVIDDVVVLAALPLVGGIEPGASAGSVAVGLGGALCFVALVTVAGPRLARRHGRLLERPVLGRGPFILALAICLGLAALAERVGLAALVGAFLAGMVLAETRDHYQLERRMEPLFDLLVPFFFVVSAARMDPGALARAGVPFLAAIVPVAVVAKAAGCSLGAVGLPLRDRARVGAGMIPRGEVTLAVAASGLAAGDLASSLYSALLAIVLVSALAAPLLLKATTPSAGRPGAGRPIDVPPEASGREGEPGEGREGP